MKLQEIFDQLGSGEFSQLSIGGAAAGVIDETNWTKVLGHVNLGLTALFKRFMLKEGSLVVTLEADKETYKLNASDIFKVERVLTDGGVELGLNDHANPRSVFTSSMSTLRVPKEVVDELDLASLTVFYRANHPTLKIGLVPFDPERIELQLPYSHLEPLLYYVASRVHNPIGMTGEFNAGNNYAAKYEMSCQALEGQGLQIDQGQTNTRLFRNGWV